MAQVRLKKKKKPMKHRLFTWAACLGAAAALAFTVQAAGFELMWVDGSSMEGTLHHGEVMLVTKFDYLFGQPERFQVVTCRYPGRTESFVKRIVALPGDQIEIRDGTLYLNGQPQAEPYITHRPNYQFGPYLVKDGEYFVLGDNRSNSNDSHLVGPLSRDQITGHGQAVLYPFSQWRKID